MKHVTTMGLAIAMLAGGMCAGDAQALCFWPTPTTACTSANAWQTEDVYYHARGQNLQITYMCDPDFGWTLWEVCDLNPGGICVAY